MKKKKIKQIIEQDIRQNKIKEHTTLLDEARVLEESFDWVYDLIAKKLNELVKFCDQNKNWTPEIGKKIDKLTKEFEELRRRANLDLIQLTELEEKVSKFEK